MPWPKAILEEFGLWPVWVPQGAASLVADAQADGGATLAAPDAIARATNAMRAASPAQADELPPWDVTPVAATSARTATMAPPAAVRPAARAAGPDAASDHASDGAARGTQRRMGAAPPDDIPMWLDADGSGDGDAAADAALWSIMREAGEAGQASGAAVRPAVPALDTLDWDALTERVSNCRLCGLCEKRTQTVFGVGDREADWLLVGEAPGQQEDLQGEPFVGQAGKLLDNMLRAVTLRRGENVYIANVLKCRPPNNRDPEPGEVTNCEPYLKRQVALLKPRVIVVMGRFAAQSILRTQASIASLRGRVHEYEGVPVIVTYHPAYLLRSLPDKAKAWTDWCLARATYEAVCESTPANKPMAN
ncbi:uracil-DNA glycosylase [Pandoraea nosoerga]|uniref:Type-4 uracil-DNA glycosylase n=1 Tax=Pandoraea nosoerga TaxID=2508296 RepID=A0A5E4VFU1_9BURK|nr:uracil-DNA glycosylase [Pandoraea nosoerga]MBN4665999.1 uracil-DNA glycosylase [Pandoraea nosoerga]MBN4676173.1 uracil-DNA glycosylase [Pandoraea nosoerga]MBN4681229.1 uracil-DNA glycosylase [Pandoraea nosoerga]MBN4745283.1 uracil-DNA glycosylase [Pandoraea nosoerga]VVE09820.1 uracil-DNA glycosylase [Pandoraea nosoerga]